MTGLVHFGLDDASSPTSSVGLRVQRAEWLTPYAIFLVPFAFDHDTCCREHPRRSAGDVRPSVVLVDVLTIVRHAVRDRLFAPEIIFGRVGDDARRALATGRGRHRRPMT